MIFRAINHLTAAIYQTVGRHHTAELPVKVVIEVSDPYTKELLVAALNHQLDQAFPDMKKTAPPGIKIIRDSFHCCGIEYEFREPGVPTEMEEINRVD